MKSIKLTYNQSKRVMLNYETIRVSRNGIVVYVSYNGEKVIAKTWLGILLDINIIINDYFN